MYAVTQDLGNRDDGMVYSRRMEPSDNEFILSITPDVMACLTRSDYFKKLDDILSPEDSSTAARSCDGTFRLSESILVASGFDRDAIDDILSVLKSKGGCCDCEVLYNVVETNRLKSKYWSSRGDGSSHIPRHSAH